MRIVPENVLVNKEGFLKELLTPIGKKDIPKALSRRGNKGHPSINGAHALVHPNVVQWSEISKIKYIPARR